MNRGSSVNDSAWGNPNLILLLILTHELLEKKIGTDGENI